METKITVLEYAVTNLASELKQLGKLISAAFTKTDANFSNVRKQFVNLRQQLDIANKNIILLKGETNDGFGDVGVKLENLSEEISKNREGYRLRRDA